MKDRNLTAPKHGRTCNYSARFISVGVALFLATAVAAVAADGPSTNSLALDPSLALKNATSKTGADLKSGQQPKKNLFSKSFRALKLTGKKAASVSVGIVKDMNPFAPMPAEESLKPVEGTSPRAWSTTVGWYPGRSAFPDPITSWP